MTTEQHPLQPFLPAHAEILFLGSFPPPRAKWSMDFFYPNWINDFWRILGIVHFNDRSYFEVPGEKKFDREKIIQFAEAKGIALYDTACRVNRLADNADDTMLEVIESTDVTRLLQSIPQCHTIATTGIKASNLLMQHFGLKAIPGIGKPLTISVNGRTLQWYRTPSSSRAYPLAFDKKVNEFRKLWE
ncbi:MAG: uracil-DNA glycosylase family protein [Bacteroidales bacterium]|nr:uracil-DNA glycosylase family protein [Bacteroidales bacterium]